jgi:LPXTG-motif cell wall-anchored protein
VKQKSLLAAAALVLLCGLSSDAAAQYPSRNSNRDGQNWNRFAGRRDDDDRRNPSHRQHSYTHVHIPHWGGTSAETSGGRQTFTSRTQNFKPTIPPIKVSSSVRSTGASGRGWLAGLGAALAAGFGALFGRRKES